MSDTALIDEVREIRHHIAAECENNLEKITRYAKEIAQRLGFQPHDLRQMSTH
ncbi:MAG: hypothetical protein IJI36_10275 [Kiritimatiellae bacterium]|nr:hypothetical protein [Kiritimatiellia bacterium]